MAFMVAGACGGQAEESADGNEGSLAPRDGAAGTDAAVADTGAVPDAAPGDARPSDATTTGDADAGALPLCTWPSAFDDADVAAGQCVAGRMFLSCEGSNATAGCLSNDGAVCPAASSVGGAYGWNCENQCNPDEFGLVCGGTESAPRKCRMMLPTPGGIVFFCCPCDSRLRP